MTGGGENIRPGRSGKKAKKERGRGFFSETGGEEKGGEHVYARACIAKETYAHIMKKMGTAYTCHMRQACPMSEWRGMRAREGDAILLSFL